MRLSRINVARTTEVRSPSSFMVEAMNLSPSACPPIVL